MKDVERKLGRRKEANVDWEQKEIERAMTTMDQPSDLNFIFQFDAGDGSK